ncbi:MAG: DUF3267 domain-containing protein [Anaerolineae bacterium]|nr:DUF3267 domain-containing protein [Anaerolineae bacterium]
MAVFTALPDNYESALDWRLNLRRWVCLVAASLGVLFAAAVVMLAYWVAYEAIGAPLALAFLEIPVLGGAVFYGLVAALILVIAVMPVHELCHALALKRVGVKKIRYGIIWRKMVCYATPAEETYLYRNDFIFMALAPLALITIGCMALMLFAPAWLRLALGLAAAVNANGAIGDIWWVGVVWSERFPPDALVRDLGDTFVVYTPVAR